MDLSDALKTIMGEHGWTQTDLAHQLGQSQSWVSQVTRGVVDPGIRKTRRLLGPLGWKVDITPKSTGDRVKRREFVTAAASIVFIPTPKTGPYGDHEYVSVLAQRLGKMTEEQGGNALVGRSLQHLRCIKNVVKSRDKKLQIAASDLARKASLVLYDADRDVEAEHAAILGVRLAEEAAYIEGIAHGFENLCKQSSSGPDPRRAAMYAQRGLALPGLTDVQKARINARFGVACVKNQTHDSARLALAAIDKSQNIDGLPTRDSAVVLGSAGVALCALGHYGQADDCLRDAVRLFSDSPQLSGRWLCRRIITALQAGNPSQAAEQISTLARIVPLVSSSRLNKHIGKIFFHSAKWNTSKEMKVALEHLRSATNLQ